MRQMLLVQRFLVSVLSKKNWILKFVFFLFIEFCIFSKEVVAFVQPTSSFYVNDYASLLSENTKEYIQKANEHLYSKTGSQIVVVTIPNLEGNSLEEYATELFRTFGIGDSKKNNGLLLLLTLEERQFRVEVGYGLEGILPDAKTGRIQDEYIIPYLKQNKWDEGIQNGFKKFLDEIVTYYGVDLGMNIDPTQTESEKGNGFLILFSTFGLPLLSSLIGASTKELRKQQNGKKKFRKFTFFYLLGVFLFYLLYFRVFFLANTEIFIYEYLFFVSILTGINVIAFASGRSKRHSGGISIGGSSFGSSGGSHGGGGSSGGGGSFRNF